MFIDVTTGDLGNPTGTDTEADDYLNTLEASLAGWGEFLVGADDWVGWVAHPMRDFRLRAHWPERAGRSRSACH